MAAASVMAAGGFLKHDRFSIEFARFLVKGFEALQRPCEAGRNSCDGTALRLIQGKATGTIMENGFLTSDTQHLGCAPPKANGTVHPLFLEDLQVGQRFTSGVYVMDESGIKRFAAEFDPQPFHLDESAAQASVFGGLAASGWHTAAAAMRLLVTGGLPFANGLVGLGGEIAWPRPTRPGDRLQLESEIVSVSHSRSKPRQGIVTVRSSMYNQNHEPVYVFTAKILAFRRPAAD